MALRQEAPKSQKETRRGGHDQRAAPCCPHQGKEGQHGQAAVGGSCSRQAGPTSTLLQVISVLDPENDAARGVRKRCVEKSPGLKGRTIDNEASCEGSGKVF